MLASFIECCVGFDALAIVRVDQQPSVSERIRFAISDPCDPQLDQIRSRSIDERSAILGSDSASETLPGPNRCTGVLS
jgi:hypothetical protein